MADEDLKDIEDMFDASNDEDLADFMNMLDNIDADASELAKEIDQEIGQTDTTQLEQELDLMEDTDNPFNNLFDMSDEEEGDDSKSTIDDMMAGLGLEDDESEDDAVPVDIPKFDAEDSESMEIPDEDDSVQIELPDMDDSAPIEIPDMDDDTSFVAPQEEDLLNLMDDEEGMLDLGGNFMADESEEEEAEELADFLGGVEEGAEEQEVEYVEKKGLIRRIIDKFHKTPSEEEVLARQQEEEEERAWEEAEKAKVDEKKAEAAEAKKAKKEEAEKKKQEKAEKKEAQKAAAAEKKAAQQAAKEAKRGPIPKSQIVPMKPLCAFVVIGIAIGVVFVFFTNYRFYNASIDKSKDYFIHRKYREAFEELLGLEIKKKDEKFYEQVKTVRIVDKDLEAYNNYVDRDDYEMALTALVKGVGKYETQSEKAQELNLDKEMHNLYEEMVSELANRFQITAQDAVNLYQSKDKEYYKKTITQIARDAALRDGVMDPVSLSAIEEDGN